MTSISDTEVVNAPGGLVELGYSQITSGVAINNGVAGTGVEVIAPLTVVCDGSPIMVEFFTPEARPYNAANYELNISLFEDSSEKIRSWGRQYNGVANFDNKPVHLMARLSPSAGSHTYSVKAYVTNTSPSTNTGRIEAGSGTTGSAPAFLRVSKILQASQLLVTQSNAPIVTSLPAGNLVTGQEVDLYVTSPYAGYQRYKWNGSAWYMMGDSRGAEWQSFSPGIANITLGNGTLQSRYRVYGKTINYIGQLQWGSTTSASGYFVVNLPTNAYNSLIVGSVLMIDGGTRAWTGSCAPWSAGQFYIIHTESGNFGGVNQTNPFTWGNGDYFTWNITYEMA